MSLRTSLLAPALLLASLGLAAAQPTPVHAASVPTSSITLLTANPALGTTVYFKNVFPKATVNPLETVECYQAAGATFVDNYSVGEGTSAGVLLGGTNSYWLTVSPGPATCAVRLYSIYYRHGTRWTTMLATISFNAAG